MQTLIVVLLLVIIVLLAPWVLGLLTAGAVVYVGALVVALIIGLILIGYQQIRARLNDPELLERRRVSRLIQRSNEVFKEPPPKWQQREND